MGWLLAVPRTARVSQPSICSRYFNGAIQEAKQQLQCRGGYVLQIYKVANTAPPRTLATTTAVEQCTGTKCTTAANTSVQKKARTKCRTPGGIRMRYTGV